MEGKELTTTVSFGFSLKFYGGNFDYGRGNFEDIHVPVAFLEHTASDEEAFESYTGLDRCHMLYANAEEDEDQRTSKKLARQQKHLEELRAAHYYQCTPCEIRRLKVEKKDA